MCLASSAATSNSTEPRRSTEPTSEDFYSVIYIFTSPASLTATPPSPAGDSQSRGIWHLARCLLALQRSYRDISPATQSLAPPHLAWADCSAAEFLLNLTTAFPRFLRLLGAYQNLTSAFGRWPTGLMGGAVAAGGRLPIPEFLKPQAKTHDTPVISLPPPPPPVVVVPPPPPPPPIGSLQEEEEEEAPPPVDLKAGEHEVVLPAAMGGSWKEAVYMRLNNKVLQLQSDVSVSMRYLEELSQSYKRQTERLSASFNLTTAWLKATAKGAEARDLRQQERIVVLEAQLAKLLHILADQGLVEFTASPGEFQRPFNRPSVWSALFKPPAPPLPRDVCASTAANVSKALPPRASLLFLPRGEAKPRQPLLTCLATVFLRHLRAFLLSETFRLWMLHLGLAVLAQLLVYLAFLRSVLRRCLTAVPPPQCKIGPSTSSSFSLNPAEDVKSDLLFTRVKKEEEELSLWQATAPVAQEWQFSTLKAEAEEAEANSTGDTAVVEQLQLPKTRGKSKRKRPWRQQQQRPAN